MIPSMKWHIYENETKCPLVALDDRVIDFDTEEEAKQFAKKWLEDDVYFIKKDILFYDGGRINVKELVITKDE